MMPDIVTQAEVTVTVGGPDVAKWIARHYFELARHPGPGSLRGPLTEMDGLFMVGLTGGVLHSEIGVPYLDPDATVTFAFSPGALPDDLDPADAASIARAALEVLVQALGDVQVAQITVEVKSHA